MRLCLTVSSTESDSYGRLGNPAFCYFEHHDLDQTFTRNCESQEFPKVDMQTVLHKAIAKWLPDHLRWHVR